MQLTREFHSKSLGRNQDPDTFITELEALKINMKELDHDVTGKSMILHILNNLNENYDMEIKILEHQIQLLKDGGKEMGIEEVQTELNLRWEQIKRSNKNHTVEHDSFQR
jgi:3'-phosphoadenosine 5'-phosphosulfate sulfotransferase